MVNFTPYTTRPNTRTVAFHPAIIAAAAYARGERSRPAKINAAIIGAALVALACLWAGVTA